MLFGRYYDRGGVVSGDGKGTDFPYFYSHGAEAWAQQGFVGMLQNAVEVAAN